ncbi:MAG: M14 family zinc carboxypeptidase [Bacteroidales bacterium]
MKIKRSIRRGLTYLFASLALAMLLPGTVAAQGGYSDPAGVNRRIDQIRQKSGGLARVHKLTVSHGGTDILLLEIGKKGEVPNPAVLVVGNLSGISPVTTEAALSLAGRIASDASLCSQLTWYVVPMGNPDAYSRYFSTPLYMDPGNNAPHNDDMDDQVDEDGFNDLDGNGIITMMRVKSPDGIWVPVASEPRLMRRADASKGEKGIYKIYTEGIDDDGDGQYNEDGTGGTDINANFPHLFKFFDPKSGLFPGSAREAGELVKFAFAHPEIAMTISFGRTNFLLVPPKGGRKGSVDYDNITIPGEIGKAMGFDVSRTYTMQEIMEAVQPMLPPGMTIDEGMIASYLGLGAVVNPMQEDLVFYNKISGEYKDHLKSRGVAGERFDPEDAKEGSFEMWAYYHLGVPVFSMDIWALDKPQTEKKESGGITLESLEKMNKEEFSGLGEDKISAFLKERGAPAQYTAKMVISLINSGQATPAQMAAMMKQMPAPPSDEQKGDPVELAHLAFSDSKLGGKGFVNWKPFNHPTLGEAEIGGFAPYSGNTPPYPMVDSLLDLHLPFIFELVKKLPKLHIMEAKAIEKGSGVFQIEVWIENNGYLPFPTEMGKRNKIPAPAVITLEGTGIEFLSGLKRTPLHDLAGNKSVKLTWLVKADKRSTLIINLMSKQAGSDSKQINIGG